MASWKNGVKPVLLGHVFAAPPILTVYSPGGNTFFEVTNFLGPEDDPPIVAGSPPAIVSLRCGWSAAPPPAPSR